MNKQVLLIGGGGKAKSLALSLIGRDTALPRSTIPMRIA